MERALVTHDFSHRLRGRQQQPGHAAALHDHRACGRRWPARSCCGASILSGYIAAMVWRFRRQAADPLVGWATLVTYVVAAFFFGLMAGPGRPVPDRGGRGAGQRARAQRAAAGQPAGGVPPAAALPGLRRASPSPSPSPWPRSSPDGSARAGSSPPGAGRCSPGAFLTVGDRARRVVVVPGARLGRVLGLGPGRERVVPAVAVRHRLPALGPGPGATGPAAGVEPVARHRHLQPDHPRHLPHPVGRDRVGARLLRLRHRRRCCSASSASSW